MKSFKGLLVIGEQNIFRDLASMVSIAGQANAILKTMYQFGGDEKVLTAKMNEIRALEKKSDDIAFRLNEDITSGAISPNIIDTLIEAVHVADNIVDTIFYLSRELTRTSKSDVRNFASTQGVKWTKVYGNMLDLADQSIQKLNQMLLTNDVNQVIQLRKEIESIEEKADDIKDAALDNLYRFATELHFLQFYSYSEMLHKSDDILDNAEDLSDIVVSAVTSILK